MGLTGPPVLLPLPPSIPTDQEEHFSPTIDSTHPSSLFVRDTC